MKLVIFDLDGTVLNTIGDLAAACNHILKEENLPQFGIDEYRYFVGQGVSRLVERIIPPHLRTDAYIRQMKAAFLEYYEAHIFENTTPYEGIPELLRTLTDMNIKIAVASNKYRQGVVFLLEHFFKDIDFTAMMGTSDLVPTKPNPTMVYEILKLARVTPDEAIYVGDTNTDMITARNAGIAHSVGVTWGFRTREELVSAGAWQIVDKPEEILSLL